MNVVGSRAASRTHLQALSKRLPGAKVCTMAWRIISTDLRRTWPAHTRRTNGFIRLPGQVRSEYGLGDFDTIHMQAWKGRAAPDRERKRLPFGWPHGRSLRYWLQALLTPKRLRSFRRYPGSPRPRGCVVRLRGGMLDKHVSSALRSKHFSREIQYMPLSGPKRAESLKCDVSDARTLFAATILPTRLVKRDEL